MQDHQYLQEPGINITTMYWGKPMKPVDKMQALSWPASRIIKTVYFEKDSKLYGFVLPLDKEVDLRIAAPYIGISKRRGKRLKLASKLPEQMQPDSAGPFITEKDKDLVSMILFDRLDDKIVDFSYPGRSDISLHMLYSQCFDMLQERFPDIIKPAYL